MNKLNDRLKKHAGRKGQLLSLDKTAQRLGVARITVVRHLVELQAAGVRVVPCGKLTQVHEGSLEKVIERAAERGERLW